MSADNFYLIRKHPAGGYSAVMGFASADDVREAYPTDIPYPTVDQAILSVVNEYAEYGIQVHPECHDK